MRVMAKTGIDWIEEPNFMIKGFIEKDIAESQVKMGKFLRSIYQLDGQLWPYCQTFHSRSNKETNIRRKPEIWLPAKIEQKVSEDRLYFRFFGHKYGDRRAQKCGIHVLCVLVMWKK